MHYVAFSLCEESLAPGLPKDTLMHECRAAVPHLGMDPDNVRFLDYRVRRFAERRQDVLDALIKIRREVKPDLVLTPSSFDVHQDHQVIHQEARRAFKTVTLLGYELPWNCARFDFDLMVGISEDDLAAKTNALAEYKSQGHRPYTGAETLRATATYHGLKSGTPMAEAFEVIRWIVP